MAASTGQSSPNLVCQEKHSQVLQVFLKHCPCKTKNQTELVLDPLKHLFNVSMYDLGPVQGARIKLKLVVFLSLSPVLDTPHHDWHVNSKDKKMEARRPRSTIVLTFLCH